jgi:copper homeostasis protein (lipoprotein)
MRLQLLVFLIAVLAVSLCGCKGKPPKKNAEMTVYKGLYSYGPEVKSFQACNTSREFWVTDKSEQLELQYSQFNFAKPDVPVYIEVEGEKTLTSKNGMGSGYDSTLVVKKLIKISKDIPKDCN